MLRTADLNAGVLRKVRILAGARESSKFELYSHIIHDFVVVMMCAAKTSSSCACCALGRSSSQVVEITSSVSSSSK